MKQELLYNVVSTGDTMPFNPDILHIYADNPDNDIDGSNKVVSMANDYGNDSVDVSNGSAQRLDFVSNKLNGLPAFKSGDYMVHKITNVFGDSSLFQDNDFTVITVVDSDNDIADIPRHLGYRNSDAAVFGADATCFDLCYTEPSLRFDNKGIRANNYTKQIYLDDFPFMRTTLAESSTEFCTEYFNDATLWLPEIDTARFDQITSDTLYIGQVRGSGNGYTFYYYEIMMFSWLLSTTEISEMYTYLNNKWNFNA